MTELAIDNINGENEQLPGSASMLPFSFVIKLPQRESEEANKPPSLQHTVDLS